MRSKVMTGTLPIFPGSKWFVYHAVVSLFPSCRGNSPLQAEGITVIHWGSANSISNSQTTAHTNTSDIQWLCCVLYTCTYYIMIGLCWQNILIPLRHNVTWIHTFWGWKQPCLNWSVPGVLYAVIPEWYYMCLWGLHYSSIQ